MNKNTYFFPRVVAYFIDIFLVSLVASLALLVVPTNSNLVKLEEEATNLSEKYLNEEITTEEYIRQGALITYDVDYASVLTYIIEVIFIILYFVVFQFYNKGQTIGKKIMKIKVVGIDDRKLTINDYFYRSLIINSVLVNILIIVGVMFINRNYYFYANTALQIIQIILSLVTIFMVLFRKDKRGLHDIVAHSEVVASN